MRWSSALDAVPVVLDAVVEGAWLAIAYLVVQVLWAHGGAYLGPLEFAVLAGAGLLLARGGAGQAGLAPLALLAVAAGLGGWLLAPAARAALLAGDPYGALAAHPGGWLAALAVIRGAAHGLASEDDLVVARLLERGVPALAVPWLLAQVAAPAARAAFVEPAFVATLTFVVSGLLAVAVARLDALGASSGVDWRHNRAWLLVLGSIVAAMVLLGLPIAAVLGVPLDAALRGALGPVWLLVTAIIAVIALPAGLLAAALAALLHAILGHPQPSPGVAGPPAPPGIGPEALPPGSTAILAMLAVALVLIGLVVAALRVLPGRRQASDQADEERSIVVPEGTVRASIALPHWRGRGRGAAAPTDAAGAYVAALADLASDPSRARAADETPGAHVKRLRASGRGLRPLERLAADYQVDRYAGRRLTAAENRRGLARWRTLREILRAERTPRRG